MATKFKVEGLEIIIGKAKEFTLDTEEQENLLWFGITYIVTTVEGIKIFYLARDIYKKRKVKSYLKFYKVDPNLVLPLLD